VILRSEAEAMTGQLDVSNNGINDLTGIEAFTNLIRLKAWNNALINVDVTQNTLLERLEIVGNQLTDIDVTQNTELTVLWLENNQLSTVDVSQNTKLYNLALGINPLISIDVTTNVDLWALTTEVTQISEIDLSENINLQQLWIADNPNLTQIDLSKNPLLFNLGIYNTSITTLDVSNNSLTRLWANDNPNLKSLDLRNGKNIDLTDFIIYNTPNLNCINADGIGIPDISQVMVDSGKTFSEDCGDFIYIHDPNFEQTLIDLGIDSDGVVNTSILKDDTVLVESLNLTNPLFQSDGFENPLITTVTEKISDLTGIEAFVDLTNLQLGNGDLTSVDLSNNSNLEELFLNDNQLTTIDITSNTQLKRFGVMRNPIVDTTVDVSQNSLLEELFLHNTGIQNIDLSNNLNLSTLFIQNNNLTTLDVELNSQLFEIRCQNNQLSQLDITTLQMIDRVDANNNPEFTLITDPIVGNSTLRSLNLSATGQDNFNGAFYPNLQWLLLNNNNLTKFNGNNNAVVEYLFLDNNFIDKLVFSANNTMLKRLDANNNVLSELDLRNGNNIELTTLNVTGNLLTCISVDDPTDATQPYPSWNFDAGVILSLDCKGEPEIVLIPDANFEQALIDGGIDQDGIGHNGSILLSDALATVELDVYLRGIVDMTGIEAFENLEILDASFNNFDDIDLTNCTKLTQVNLTSNNLTSLMLTSTKDLTQLYVGINNLTSLNLEELKNLTNVDLDFNNFTNIDASNLDKLVQFVVANNALQTLNMQNGNNQQVINFSSAGNPDLFCIAVDDANNIPSDWIKDPWSNYSNNVDCISPTIVAQDVTVYLDNKGEATVNAEDFDNGSADNITLAENLLFSVNILDFDCSNLNITNNVELTVTDEAGNFSKAPVNLFVLDDILPTVSAKPTFTADLNGMSVYELNPLDILKSSQDNCSVVDYTVNPTTFTTLGIYEVTLTAIDGSGNTAQDTSEVEIIDSLASKDLKFGGTTAVIFPVPFGNELSMTFSKVVNLSSVSGQLTDMLGNSFPLVFSPSNGNGTFVSADTSFLLSGSYILQVSLGNKSDSEVVVKE
ncbi:MAG: hypothetical protein KJO41_12490, partial [Bacteroidia bacterium]|nr:hypothetical protein [Bacteroidia bacterium]